VLELELVQRLEQVPEQQQQVQQLAQTLWQCQGSSA
jgi:hypothetical protein